MKKNDIYLSFSIPGGAIYNLNNNDEIFYIKDTQIWVLVYPGLEKIDNKIKYLYEQYGEYNIYGEYKKDIENYCYASLIEGKKCQ